MRETGGDVVLEVEEVLPEEALERADVDDRGNEEKEVVAGPDFERTAFYKRAESTLPVRAAIFDEKPADEEAAEDEEDVDAGPAEAFDAVEDGRGDEEVVAGAVVEDEDHQDGDAADEIEFDFTPGVGGEAIARG